MPRIPLFTGGSYTTDSPDWSADRTVNLYSEVGETGATASPMRLRGSPGLSLFSMLPTSPVRGIWVNEHRLFAAGGSRSYEVFQNGTFQDRGDIGDDAGHSPVQMFPNGNQLFIVSAGMGYIDTGTAMVPITLGTLNGIVNTNGTTIDWVSGDTFDLPMVGQTILINTLVGGILLTTLFTVASVRGDGKQATLTATAGMNLGVAYQAPLLPLTVKTGAFLDGYFIAARPDSKQFNISALYNGLEWDPIDFGIKEGYPDNIASIIADHEELWLLGTETTEVWRNTGNSDFPFERDLGAFIHQGCAAPWSVVRLANGVAWLGGDSRGQLTAWRAQGFVPVRVSTHAVEQAWRTYASIADAIGFTFRMDGHEFWQINFPTADKTWVYDATTGLWHERTSGAGRHLGRAHGFVYAWGKHLVGDYTSGAIYEMSPSFFDDAGAPIERLRQGPHLVDEELRLFYHRLQLSVESGSGVADAVFELSWSDDGGHTWSTPIPLTGGAIGAFTTRFIWRRLGEARDRTFRIRSTAAIQHSWIDAFADLTKGTS
jgi:hypothetical protein